MDSEIVAIDPSDGSLRTFQELSTRARKDVNLADVQVPVGVFGFDLMYLDGKVCICMPVLLADRRNYFCCISRNCLRRTFVNDVHFCKRDSPL